MATATVKDYLSYLEHEKYPALFDEECMQRFKKIKAVYGDLHTEETILEIIMNSKERSCDYSMKVLSNTEAGKEYWYELDYEFYKSTDMLLPMLKKCVRLPDGKKQSVLQLGAMTSGGQKDSLRLVTFELTKEEVISYLRELDWKGNFEYIEKLLSEFEPYIGKKSFILDFTISEKEISEKIGICFGTKDKRYKTVEKMISFFVEKKLCLPEKCKEMLRWNTRYPAHTPFIQNDISHFKFEIKGEKLLEAKAYLRQGEKLRNTQFRAYDTPVVMNLELTTKCPLHCPQCYCELNTGKDLPLNEALYWLEEAAASHVKTVNLSGGETACYPHLTQLIKRCHQLGMMANIALSGYKVTKDSLKEWMDAGVHGIFISVNGSTEKINSKTRDGFELAVKAMKLLKETGFDNTCINWVMHGCNADDFSNMITMAEKYGMKQIAVMVFKPDASHQLPGLPTEKQMQEVVKIIKNYKGCVQIEVEECFSQMRAMLGEKYFFNSNIGISRGCGAGRDGISINADGKITPCRHLDFPEETRSIREYWHHSEVIKKLRNVEDEMESPCAECRFKQNCLPCAAVNVKLHKKIAMGNKECVIAENN